MNCIFIVDFFPWKLLIYTVLILILGARIIATIASILLQAWKFLYVNGMNFFPLSTDAALLNRCMNVSLVLSCYLPSLNRLLRVSRNIWMSFLASFKTKECWCSRYGCTCTRRTCSVHWIRREKRNSTISTASPGINCCGSRVSRFFWRDRGSSIIWRFWNVTYSQSAFAQ